MVKETFLRLVKVYEIYFNENKPSVALKHRLDHLYDDAYDAYGFGLISDDDFTEIRAEINELRNKMIGETK